MSSGNGKKKRLFEMVGRKEKSTRAPQGTWGVDQ